MSLLRVKRTWPSALHMSAFGGKADLTVCRCPLSRSLLGVERTCRFALHMSAYDPKRTSLARLSRAFATSALLERVAELMASVDQPDYCSTHMRRREAEPDLGRLFYRAGIGSSPPPVTFVQ